MKELENNNTWEIVEGQGGMKQTRFKWVYTVENKLNGIIDCYKAQVVAKEYTQTHRNDYE